MTEIIHTETKKGIWGSPYFLMLVSALGVFTTALDSYIFVPARARGQAIPG